MAKLEKIAGSYGHTLIIQPGGFQLNGSSAPTILRDATNVSTASGKMFTVARVSAGLYTVTFTAGFPMPELPFILPKLEQAAAPTAPCKIHLVKPGWVKATRSFQVQIQTVTTTPAASDGDAADRVSFLIIGSIISVGTDPA